MANESKFINIQRDPCDLVKPEEKPIDRVCPTCIPDPNNIPPDWWKQKEPWLNQNTCEYSVAVYINQDGNSYRLSDLKTILDPQPENQVILSKSGIPTPTPTSGAAEKARLEEQFSNEELFDKIKRSYVKTGIRHILRHFDKTIEKKYICANNDCSVFSTSDARKYVRQRKHYASIDSDISFDEWVSAEDSETVSLPFIDNLNALELFASATEYYFYGLANGVMAVLVTVPAYILDQVPNEPIAATVDTNVASIKFKVSEFKTWIEKMEEIFSLFSKFQSSFHHTTNGRLYHTVEDKEAPFYASFMKGRFKSFERSLSRLIEKKGYNYYNAWELPFSDNSQKVLEIEIIFDKNSPATETEQPVAEDSSGTSLEATKVSISNDKISDSKKEKSVTNNKPYKLIDVIKIKPANCDWIELKLPPQPEQGDIPTDTLRSIAFFDQTLMTYIANYSTIKDTIDARKTPPWLDFLVENTFPPLSVDYGNSTELQSDRQNGCLLDKFEQLDDFILNETMGFFESFAYQFNKNNCRLLENKNKGKPTVFDGSKEGQKLYDKAVKSQKQRQLKKKEELEAPVVKDAKKTEAVDDGMLKDLMNKLSPCNWKKITLKGIQCLMGGLTLEDGLKEIIKGTIGTLTTEGMEMLLAGLPADKQEAVRSTIQKEFKDLPAPWEAGYEPGDVESAYDREALNSINQSEAKYTTVTDIEKEISNIETKISDIEKETYSKYYNDMQKLYNKARDAVDQVELNHNIALDALYTASSAHGAAERTLAQAEVLLEQALLNPQNQVAIQYRQEEVADATSEFTATEKDEENAAANVVNLESKLRQAQRNKDDISLMTQSEYNSAIVSEKNRLVTELEKLREKLTKAEEEANKESIRSPNSVGFSDKTEEEQQEIIDQEKQKVEYASLQEGDKYKQGTYGRAVGNVQKELMKAYGEAIIENASVQEIMTGIDSLPGADIMGQFFSSFKCPNYSFAYPPIDEFLGTFTVGACGKGKTRPFSVPELKKLPSGWDIWESLQDAFLYALKKTMGQVVSALILKTIQLGESALCKSLALAGQGVSDAYEATQNDGRFPRSLNDILNDVICTDQLDDNEEKIDDLFSLSGAPQRGSTTPKQVLETLSTLGSEQDYLNAMTAGEGQQDRTFLENASRTIGIIHPDYDSLASPDGLGNMLRAAGNFLTEEQRQRARELAQNSQQFFPLDDSICLTNEQAQRYYDELTRVYAEQIGDSSIAEEFVNNQKNKSKSDLSKLAESLAKGPEGLLKDALDDLFGEPDPDCELDKSLLKTPEEIKELKSELTSGVFARLQKAFLDDTIDENLGENFFGLDVPGALLTITADSVGYNYAQHYRLRNEWLFIFLSWLGLFDAEAPFPDTIGGHLREMLLQTNPEIGYDGRISFEYNNGLTEDNKWDSIITINEILPSPVIPNQHRYNFDYEIEIGKNNQKRKKKIIVENHISEEERLFLAPYQPSDATPLVYNNLSSEMFDNYRNNILKNILQEKISFFAGTNDLEIKKIADIGIKINNFLFGEFKNSLLKSEDGGISNGFRHGGAANQPITVDDLTYVDPVPGATSYTYDEEDAVLGKSLTDNPRVKFLDPLKHGGSFDQPNIHISPDTPDGWLTFCKVLNPTFGGCGDSESSTNFLGLDALGKELSDKEDKIKSKPELSQSPECVNEIPFDKIASSATLAMLEQTIIATIRLHLTEFMINSFGIHGNLAFNNNNYDELLYEYVSDKIQNSLSEQYYWLASTYEGYTYWLLFLEQCAQVFNRRIKDAKFEPNQEEQTAMGKINNAQIKYTKPVRKSSLQKNDLVINKNNQPETIEQFLEIASKQFGIEYAYTAVGGYLIWHNTKKWQKTFSGDLFGDADESTIMRKDGFFFWTQNQMNFAAKIATIAENEENCKVFLKRLIREQVDYYSNKLSRELTPRPLIYDINKFFIGGSNTLYGNGIRAGIYDVEVPIGGDATTEQTSGEIYGNIINCSKDNLKHPLISEANIDSSAIEKIKLDGGFYLEKYLRIIPKIPKQEKDEDSKVGFTPEELEAKAKDNAPDNLPDGVQNIDDFVDYLKTQNIPDHINVSDWFGNAIINNSKGENAEPYAGSIGIKMGVRLCYILNKDISSSINVFDNTIANKQSILERTFALDGIPNTYTIPLASFEKDILDVKLATFKEANKNFNQDIKCFVDGLTETSEFKVIFNKIFNIKKIGSYLACYCENNFFPSLGLGANERRDKDLGSLLSLFGLDNSDIPQLENRTKLFNDSKEECRKIFVSNYKRNDFNPPSEESDTNESDLQGRKLLSKSFNAITYDPTVGWMTKARVKNDNPTDKDGNPCQNQFGGLFNIKK